MTSVSGFKALHHEFVVNTGRDVIEKRDILSTSRLMTSRKIWTQEATDTVWLNCDKHQMFS